MGQTLLVLSALLLLSFVVLQANGLILSKYSEAYDLQATLEAVSIAETKLDDATQKAFDEQSISKKIYVATDLTPPANLGPDPGETSISKYDDVDDYNGATVTFATPTIDQFTVVYKVEYVTTANPDVVSSVATFFKRVTVTITNPYMTHAVVSSRVVVYRRYQ